jgi:hypothetical protein
MLVGFWELLRSKFVEETSSNLCSERFGVALIKLRSNYWTPNVGKLLGVLFLFACHFSFEVFDGYWWVFVWTEFASFSENLACK